MDIAQPKTDKWISSPSHFHRFSPFNCWVYFLFAVVVMKCFMNGVNV